MLSNVRLQGAPDGLALTRRARKRRPDLPVVLYTTSGSEGEETSALRLGAIDYIVLTGRPHDALVVRNAVRTGLEGLRLASSASPRRSIPDCFIAASPQMHALVRKIHRVAAVEDSVLITGETGTGKELVARALHAGSARASGPLVAVNCGALSSGTGLAEAAFFGAMRGAYTGADTDRRGFLEQAAGGTLFLDELGELPEALQTLLLRFLDDRGFQRVGDPAPRHADVRVIAATNRDLRLYVAAGKFREDLLYRFPQDLFLPPLRDRLADLDAYVLHWCATLNGHPKPLRVTPAARERLRAHRWQGNLRELRSVLERAAQSAFGRTIDVGQVGPVLDQLARRPLAGPAAPAGNGLPAHRNLASDRRQGRWTPERAVEERTRIQAALAEHRGKKAKAAESLGISRWTLRRQMNDLGIWY